MQKTGVWHNQSQHLQSEISELTSMKGKLRRNVFHVSVQRKQNSTSSQSASRRVRCLTTPKRLLCTSKMNRALGCRNRLLKIDFRSYLICYRNMSEMLQKLILNKWLFPEPGMKHWLQPASRTKYKMQNQGSHFLTHISVLENYNYYNWGICSFCLTWLIKITLGQSLLNSW